MPFINPDDAQQAAPKAAFVNPDDHLPPDDLDHQSTSAVLKKQLESINAVGETAANTAVGFGGLVGGIVGAGPSVARQHISKALGITDKEPETLEQAFKGISSAITQPLYDETSSKGQDYTDWFNENVANRILTPMMGLHLGIGNIRKPNIRNPFRKLREDVNTKLDTLDQAPPTEPPAPPPARPFVNPDEAQGDLFGGYGFNEQQAAESRAQDTHPGQPDLFGPLNVPPAEMPPTTPWQRRAEPTQQGELPLQNSPQQIADMQNRGSGQPDMFSGIQENGAQPANIPGPSIQAQVQLRRLFDEHAARLAEQEAAAHRAGDAQAVIDARQAAMELEVKRQQMLDSGAAERARQERAPVAGLEEARAREQQASVDKTQPYMDERNQGLIDDTDHGYVANQFGGGQDGMRMDHAHDNLFGSDPMPIRADRSMEAQNLQDPLQRNLWGDELPRQSAQEAPRGITAAIDKMAPADRAAAIKDQFHIPNSQRGAINMDALVPGYKKERMINGGIKLTFKGGFDPKVMAHDRSGKQIAELKLNTDTYMPEPSSNMEAGHVHVDPAYRRQGIAEQMYKYVAELGNDVQASSTLLPDGRRMWEGFEKKGVADGEWRIPARQRGAIDLGKVNDSLEKVGEAKVDPYTSKERVVMNATGINHIPRGEAPESIVAQSLAEGKDGPSLFTHLQSGLQNAGEKGSALMRGVARWLSYGEKVGDYNYANKVRPLERMLNKLPTEDLVAGQTILRREMFRGAEYTPEQLKSAGLSERAIAAHQAMRQAYKDVLENTNASLRALGKKEIKADNAYMASMWNGNWHVPIKDTSGKLAWYLKVETKGEANRAINWLKNHPELSKTLDLSTAEPKYHPQNVGSRVPRDVMGAYQDMLQFFDGDVAEHMKSAMEAYTKEQGFKFQQHQQHFKNKSDIRGFQGDRPWLSEKENAMAQAKAQVQYLKEAYHWAPMQEALSNIKQVLSHPELNKMQPNNMNMAKLYTEQAMGLSRNLAQGV
jgi:GNAT superfamily N-acetyltransferase